MNNIIYGVPYGRAEASGSAFSFIPFHFIKGYRLYT
ncbi:hypothetical protein J2X17_000922 [Flavobacterium aquidurense]|nr:hypothetical protein [Flavobacterium aquidurense]